MDTQFENLIARISDSDLEIIQQSIGFYQSAQTKYDLSYLHETALRKHSQLHISSGIATNPELLVRSGRLIHRSKFCDSDWAKIFDTYVKLRDLFPESDYKIFHRVCSGEQVELKESINGVRAWFDTVGFQVIPINAHHILQAITRMEQQSHWETLFIFNTFPFSVEEFKIFISPTSSPYYRALHCYVDIGGICAEIQFRTPCIDQWSRLHHATMYKPRIETTDKEKDLIMEYGFVANWVDFSSLLSCDV